MLVSGIGNWFGPAPVAVAPLAAPIDSGTGGAGSVSGVEDGPLWSPARIGVSDALWGAGYQFPGGEIELMRLIKPMALPMTSNLLLIGAGGGGPAASLAAKMGVSVLGLEADTDLVAAAQDLLRHDKLTRRATVSLWDPANPAFASRTCHNCVALEPLRGMQPEALLSAVSIALNPGGQLTMTEIVADNALSSSDTDIADLGRLERRGFKTVPTEVHITRVLRRLGFEVRAVEDLSQRHMQQILLGWRTLVRNMESTLPWMGDTDVLLTEAQRWLLRFRLFRAGSLRLVRWHAVGRGMA